MAWESGYASDYRDLLLRLKDVIIGNALITRPVLSGAGDGVLHGIHTTPSSTPVETWTITCINDLVPATFSVVGSVSGAQANATVDVQYTSTPISFMITAGSVDFEVGDAFVFDTLVNPLVAATQVWEVKRWAGTGAKVVNYLVSSVADGSGSYNGEKAVDLDSSTGWVSQNGYATNSWWQVEFDKPVDIRKVTLGGYTTGLFATNVKAPKDFTISYSDDGVAFTVDTTRSNEPSWMMAEVREFNLTGGAGAHKFWRINIATVQSGTQSALYNLKMYSLDNTTFNVAYYGDGYDAIFRGPGTASGDDIYVTVRPDAYVHNGPNWVIEGQLGYASGLDSLEQPGYSNNTVLATPALPPRLALYDAPLKYWITVSGRLITVAARFQSICEIGQLGFYLQYAMPEQSQYPYPLIIAGSQTMGGAATVTKCKWDRVDAGHSLLFNPSTAPCSGLASLDNVPSPVRIYTPYNHWKQVANLHLGNFNAVTNKSLNTTPYQSFRRSGATGTGVQYLGPMLNGKVPLTAITIVDTEFAATYGELDGLKHVPGTPLIESIITDETDQDWVVLNNVFRVGAGDFVALRLL